MTVQRAKMQYRATEPVDDADRVTLTNSFRTLIERPAVIFALSVHCHHDGAGDGDACGVAGAVAPVVVAVAGGDAFGQLGNGKIVLQPGP